MHVSNPKESESKIRNLCPWLDIANENDMLIYEDFGRPLKTQRNKIIERKSH